MDAANKKLTRLSTVTALLLARTAGADVLPDNRADVFYSKYSGGGMDITGQSVLVRKKFSEQFSVEANYFIDTVSGSSVDVLSGSSRIKDERKQKSATVQYLRDKTTYTASFMTSVERDYISNTTHFALSQDMFGDLTTVTLGFSHSGDKVGENNGTADKPVIAWLGHAESRSYDVGVSQIVTKNLIAGLSVEVITDNGYLANPYRAVRFLDSSNPKGYSLASQVYPATHTSTAVEARAKYYLPYRAAISGSYRYFDDTWGVKANTFELDYTQPISNRWIFEGRVRYYKQGRANFYSDLFPYAAAQNFEARDRNLAGSNNSTIGAKVTYAFLPEGWKMFKRSTVTLDVSRIQFKYSDFRDIKNYGIVNGYGPGTEPLYKFSANVFQVYVSMFF